MNARHKIDMFKLTRLTREGRLEEAMAVLRGVLPDASTSSEFSGNAPADGAAPRIFDMVPPSIETGDSWTSPKSEDTQSANRSGHIMQPRIADGLGRLRRTRRFRMLVPPATGRARTPLPDGAHFDERIFANEAGSRAYKLYVPSGGKGQALPLVVMLHGCTQSPDDFAAGTRMNQLAEEQNLMVAYPAQDRSANVSKCWNWFRTGDQQRDRGEPSLIAGITYQIMRDFPVQPGRVYVAGLSAGGAAAAIMGSAYPDLYAAIGVHSGLACGAAHDVTSAFAAMRRGLPAEAESRSHRASGGIPTIVFHGDSDTTVNPINGDQVIARSKATAELRTSVIRGEARGISYIRTVQTEESGRAMLEQWVLHGAGHAWSGGSTEGTYTESRGPDASREMVRFFLQHSTVATSVC
jgi:poly(hydroxyalkanoate) depolymerase family esterase